MKKFEKVLMLICVALILFVSCGGGGGGGGVAVSDPAAPAADPGTPAQTPPAADYDEVDISELSAYFAAKPANTPATAYKIKVTGLTTSNYTVMRDIIEGVINYVDLSFTTLPDGIISLADEEHLPRNLTKSPIIPDSVTDMRSCFYLNHWITQVVIPSGVTDMTGCFQECTSLETVKILSTCCTHWNHCFENCPAITRITVPNQTVKDDILSALGNEDVIGKIEIQQ